jgi:hypothetical protein
VIVKRTVSRVDKYNSSQLFYTKCVTFLTHKECSFILRVKYKELFINNKTVFLPQERLSHILSWEIQVDAKRRYIFITKGEVSKLRLMKLGVTTHSSWQHVIK